MSETNMAKCWTGKKKRKTKKQKAKKPNRTGGDEEDYYTCPNCGKAIKRKKGGNER